MREKIVWVVNLRTSASKTKAEALCVRLQMPEGSLCTMEYFEIGFLIVRTERGKQTN